jgi:CheY-like chemotaxis protein
MQQQNRKTVLIMDDERVIRDVTAQMLDLLGFNTVEAADGKQAVEMLRDDNEGIIKAAFFDLTVPGGMGGRDAVIEVRKFRTDLPIFSSSGYSDDLVMAHPESYGFTDSIAKPYRIKDLSQLLARHLKG